MDLQLCFRLEVLDSLGQFLKEDYSKEIKNLLDQLELGKEGHIGEPEMLLKIFVEKNLLLPQKRFEQAIKWYHKVNAKRTMCNFSYWTPVEIFFA